MQLGYFEVYTNIKNTLNQSEYSLLDYQLDQLQNDYFWNVITIANKNLPKIFLVSEDTTVKKRDKNICLHVAFILVGDIENEIHRY